MKTTNTPETIIQSNQKLGFLPPLYKGFGQLDDATNFHSLNDSNKKIITDLQEILINKNGQNTSKLYVADLGITTVPQNIEHNSIELKKLYGSIVSELRKDFDVQLLSTTKLAEIMTKFYGTELGILPSKVRKEYFAMMHNYSAKALHSLIDEGYEKSVLHSPVQMKNYFNQAPGNKLNITK